MTTATMPAPTKATPAVVPGGWTGFNFTLTPNAQKVFGVVKMLGVNYTPLAFATQVVAGTNWCFLAKGTIVYPDNPEIAALIYIYEPLHGETHVTEIHRINPGE